MVWAKCSSVKLDQDPAWPHAAGRVPDSNVALKFMIWSWGKAVGLAQLAGRVPARPELEKFMTCNILKLPLSVHESGKSGKLPVKLMLVRELRQPSDCHASAVKLASSSVSMVYPLALYAWF